MIILHCICFFIFIGHPVLEKLNFLFFTNEKNIIFHTNFQSISCVRNIVSISTVSYPQWKAYVAYAIWRFQFWMKFEFTCLLIVLVTLFWFLLSFWPFAWLLIEFQVINFRRIFYFDFWMFYQPFVLKTFKSYAKTTINFFKRFELFRNVPTM